MNGLLVKQFHCFCGVKMIIISEEMKSHYQKHGYLIIKGMFNTDSESYCSRFEQAIEDMATTINVTKDEYLSAVCRWDTPCQIVGALCEEIGTVIEPLISELLEREVEVVRASVIRKSGGAGRGTHGHQDAGYWLKNASQRYDLTTWIALEDVDASNGALRVVPGSHLSGVGIHGDFLADDYVNPAHEWGNKGLTLNMSAGDMVLFSPFLWHASHGCTEDRTRAAFIVRWTGKPPVYDACDELDASTQQNSHHEFGMQTSGGLLANVLRTLAEDAGLSSPASLKELIQLALENSLTRCLPESRRAHLALQRLLILTQARELHGGNDLGVGVWEEIRDSIVEPYRILSKAV